MKILLLVPMLLAAAPALAQPSVDVRYSDLDLTRPDAVAVLDERLQKAARKVCQPRDLRDLAQRVNAECRVTALNQARKQARDATATAQLRAASTAQARAAMPGG